MQLWFQILLKNMQLSIDCINIKAQRTIDNSCFCKYFSINFII